VKRFIAISASTGERLVCATFQLKGARVEIATRRGTPREQFEVIEVVDLFTPADGVRYYDALDQAFARSSHCYIDTVPDEHAAGLGGEVP
jgi:N-acetyl-anhydromuramyl-L-alanine amidase AmpD